MMFTCMSCGAVLDESETMVSLSSKDGSNREHNVDEQVRDRSGSPITLQVRCGPMILRSPGLHPPEPKPPTVVNTPAPTVSAPITIKSAEVLQIEGDTHLLGNMNEGRMYFACGVVYRPPKPKSAMDYHQSAFEKPGSAIVLARVTCKKCKSSKLFKTFKKFQTA